MRHPLGRLAEIVIIGLCDLTGGTAVQPLPVLAPARNVGRQLPVPEDAMSNVIEPYPPCDESDLVCVHDTPATEQCDFCNRATDCDCGACDLCYDRATAPSSRAPR